MRWTVVLFMYIILLLFFTNNTGATTTCQHTKVSSQTLNNFQGRNLSFSNFTTRLSCNNESPANNNDNFFEQDEDEAHQSNEVRKQMIVAYRYFNFTHLYSTHVLNNHRFFGKDYLPNTATNSYIRLRVIRI